MNYWKVFSTIMLSVTGLLTSMYMLDIFISMISLPNTIAVFVGVIGTTAIIAAFVLVVISFVIRTVRSFINVEKN